MSKMCRASDDSAQLGSAHQAFQGCSLAHYMAASSGLLCWCHSRWTLSSSSRSAGVSCTVRVKPDRRQSHVSSMIMPEVLSWSSGGLAVV